MLGSSTILMRTRVCANEVAAIGYQSDRLVDSISTVFEALKSLSPWIQRFVGQLPEHCERLYASESLKKDRISEPGIETSIMQRGTWAATPCSDQSGNDTR